MQCRGERGVPKQTPRAPADADSFIPCGAVHSTGQIAYFGSWSPTYDGMIKRGVCARGVATSCANPNDLNGCATTDGTSLWELDIGEAAAVIL